MTPRTKLVVISRIAGARLTTVRSSITWMLELIPSGLVHCCGPPMPLSACGSSDGPAAVCAVAFDAPKAKQRVTRMAESLSTASSPAVGCFGAEEAARRLARELCQHLLELGRRPMAAAARADAGEAVDFDRIDYFRERLNAVG